MSLEILQEAIDSEPVFLSFIAILLQDAICSETYSLNLLFWAEQTDNYPLIKLVQTK